MMSKLPVLLVGYLRLSEIQKRRPEIDKRRKA
jgi:hypothetical protein